MHGRVLTNILFYYLYSVGGLGGGSDYYGFQYGCGVSSIDGSYRLDYVSKSDLIHQFNQAIRVPAAKLSCPEIGPGSYHFISLHKRAHSETIISMYNHTCRFQESNVPR